MGSYRIPGSLPKDSDEGQRIALLADWLQFRDSGGKQKDWCARHGIPAPTLSRWQGKYEVQARAFLASHAPEPPAEVPFPAPPADNPGLAMIEEAVESLPEVAQERKPETSTGNAEPVEKDQGGGLLLAGALLLLAVVGGALIGRADGPNSGSRGLR